MKPLRPVLWHWPEYAIEAAGLGLFMISACGCAALLEHPASPVRQAIADPPTRRALMGMAMAATAIALIYSPWGRRSGAHFNPAVTLTFLRLGKVAPCDFVGYTLAQFVGGAVGVFAASVILGAALSHPAVHYVATQPGMAGTLTAFAAEFVITAILMTVVLTVSNHPRFARFTGLCAGFCVATFITFEAPLSGMSLNPARSFASALAAAEWSSLWIYFTAPPLGMLLAAQLYLMVRNSRRVTCAKLQHDPGRCIFCEYHQSTPTR